MNPGIYPLDPTSTVGQLRAHLGDTGAVELDPPVAGQRSYAVYSDAALQAYLATSGGNVLRAAASAVSTIATFYAQQGNKQVKADDLGLTVSGRGATLQEIAASFLKQAESAEAAEAADIFLVASPGTCSPFPPEGTPCPLQGGYPGAPVL